MVRFGYGCGVGFGCVDCVVVVVCLLFVCGVVLFWCVPLCIVVGVVRDVCVLLLTCVFGLLCWRCSFRFASFCFASLRCVCV